MINPTLASLAFNQAGLAAMGQAGGQLSALLAEGAASYDATAMTLTATSSFRAPLGSVLEWRAEGAPELLDAGGQALTGAVAFLRFHPQGALRLRRLIGQRYDGRTDGFASRPVPFFAAIRGGEKPSSLGEFLLGSINAGEVVAGGTLSFHDEQGLIIDPVAVACLYRDLLRAFPALLAPEAGSTSDLTSTSGGSLGAICALATGTRLHLTDPFGGPYVDHASRTGLRLGSGSRLDGAGPFDWATEALNATSEEDHPLRFGLSPEGILRDTALTPPEFPATTFPAGASAPVLERQFWRVMVVDLEFHLLGNRTDSELGGVPAPDEATRREPSPTWRDDATLEFLIDGQATTGAIEELGAVAGLVLATSPTIAGDVAFPATRAGRWPAVPATTGTAEDLSADHASQARAEVSASYIGDTADVLLTWPTGALPAEAHVRAFPRVDPGPAIVPLAELDFSRRGDGGAAMVGAGETTLRLTDPFRTRGDPRPTTPRLRFDLVIATRGPAGARARLLGGLDAEVATGGTAPTTTATTNLLDDVPDNQRGISPSPILGLTPTAPAAGSSPILAAFGEAEPREAPRFRTMARTESIVAAHDGGAPGAFTSVLTPGFLTGRSVRAEARFGNPGNPAGPEDHAPGVRATGRLAQDLARAALRRTHHLLRRIPELNAGRWDEPATGTGTIAGAILQNVAAVVEDPELSLLSESTLASLPRDWDGLVSALGSTLSGLSSLPLPGVVERVVDEVLREAHAAKYGRRDSLWSLRHAITHARRLIYLETPLFGATADGTGAHEVDLVDLLLTRLAAAPDLRLIVAMPRRVPFGPGYESFAQRFYALRNEAVDALDAAAEDRVVFYHPIGFPGRPEVLRGTVAVIDDVFALVGSSSFSRRGLTFDGSIDTVFFDRDLHEGASITARHVRVQSMARALALAAAAPGETPPPNLVRLRDPRAAFRLIKEIVERGGDGLIEPLWRGLPESTLPALGRAIADPEGRDFSTILATFADVLAGLGPERV